MIKINFLEVGTKAQSKKLFISHSYSGGRNVTFSWEEGNNGVYLWYCIPPQKGNVLNFSTMLTMIYRFCTQMMLLCDKPLTWKASDKIFNRILARECNGVDFIPDNFTDRISNRTLLANLYEWPSFYKLCIGNSLNSDQFQRFV